MWGKRPLREDVSLLSATALRGWRACANAFALRDLRVRHRGMPNTTDYLHTMFAIV